MTGRDTSTVEYDYGRQGWYFWYDFPDGDYWADPYPTQQEALVAQQEYRKANGYDPETGEKDE